MSDSIFESAFIRDKIQKLPYSFVKERGILALEESEESVLVALADPLQLDALEEARTLLGKPLREQLISPELLKEAIELCYHQKESATSDLLATLQKDSKQESPEGESAEYDLLEDRSTSPVIRLLNSFLSEAIVQGASDIHFEPLEKGVSVRYRIDGILQMRHAPPKEFQAPLLTRIKVISKLDIAEQRLPQDGRIKLKMGGREIDFRVSTIPVVHGERIVLRILDKSNVLLGMHKLGMRPKILESFKHLLRLSEGIILVTGPTGSGKTTTLYSALSDINSSETNIMTIEDPVEYKLQGMAQMGVNPKIHLHFATGLRHILRQDPDVIMIGEVRDKETAEIAIQASLTGHLVLTTLHTNDAPSALTRLVEMGIEPYLLSSSVVGVLAQRLVRTICKECIESYEPTDIELKELGIAVKTPFFRGKGCPHCYDSGYKGRHGIYELMLVDGNIKRQLLNSADALALKTCAQNSGMMSLRHEGGFLVIQGITTSSEVLRVSRSAEEI